MKLFYFLPVVKITGMIRKNFRPLKGMPALSGHAAEGCGPADRLMYTGDKPFIDTELGDY